MYVAAATVPSTGSLRVKLILTFEIEEDLRRFGLLSSPLAEGCRSGLALTVEDALSGAIVEPPRADDSNESFLKGINARAREIADALSIAKRIGRMPRL